MQRKKKAIYRLIDTFIHWSAKGETKIQLRSFILTDLVQFTHTLYKGDVLLSKENMLRVCVMQYGWFYSTWGDLIKI